MLGRIYWLCVALAVFACSDAARSANIVAVPGSPEDGALIIVVGTFELGDDKKFSKVALDIDDATVLFASGGGNLITGIKIGKSIRLKEFKTVVLNDAFCASACALAWLGGSKRFMESKAAIGFHAAFTEKDGKLREDGVGNALVGAYLNQLGLPDRAVAYITIAPPESIEWLSLEKAQQYGIDVEVFYLPNRPELPKERRGVPPREMDSNGAKKFERYRNVDIVGSDVETIKGGGISSCEEACAADRRCDAFMFDRWNQVCFLKAQPRAFRLKPRATSGVQPAANDLPLVRKEVQIFRYRRREFPGKGTRSFAKSSFERCETACRKDDDCIAFSFFKKPSLCRLFDLAGEYHGNVSVDSGVKAQAND